MANFRLRLFITGHTPRSQQALQHLRSLLDEEFGDCCELEVVDVLDDPQAAEEHKVLATPTLIRELPTPIRRVIGDLSDRQQVLMGLDLKPLGTDENGGSNNG